MTKRATFTQAELANAAKVAKEAGVWVTLERDDVKITISDSGKMNNQTTNPADLIDP